MSKLVLTLLALAVVVPSTVQAAPTPAQLCESAIELASAKYAQCRLTAESKYSKTGDVASRTAALSKCSQRLSAAFSKASIRYGSSCAATEPSTAFDEYLKQCSDDAAAGAAGAALPDYVGDLASCDADLTTCDGDLTTCSADLTTCNGDLAACTTDRATAEAALATTMADLTTCEGDLASCEALPPARLLKTGQTTCWNSAGSVIPCAGTGHDGDLQRGVAFAYEDNGDGTITDANTGLMWEKLSNDGSLHHKENTYTWDNAFALKVATLNSPPCFSGHCDWRVPNLNELESIRNLENLDPAVPPAFNTGCQPGCTVLTCSCTAVSTYYWSSSSYAGYPQFVWTVRFFDGSLGNGTGNSGYYVRAVRGGS